MQHGADMACKNGVRCEKRWSASYESRVAETGTGTAGCTGELGERGAEKAGLPVCVKTNANRLEKLACTTKSPKVEK